MRSGLVALLLTLGPAPAVIRVVAEPPAPVDGAIFSGLSRVVEGNRQAYFVSTNGTLVAGRELLRTLQIGSETGEGRGLQGVEPLPDPLDPPLDPGCPRGGVLLRGRAGPRGGTVEDLPAARPHGETCFSSLAV